MKKLILMLSVLCTIVYSQDLKEPIFTIQSKGTTLLEGEFSSSSYFYLKSENFLNLDSQFTDVKFNKEISYFDLLKSGIKSLLLEYKNYRGKVTSSAYLIFSLGNYNQLTDEVLETLNTSVLPNQGILKTLYTIVKPSYKNAFKSLTFEEQIVLLNKITLCENYIEFVLINKDEKSFKKWRESSNIDFDEKAIGFLKRRVTKGQWTIKDCKYWMVQLKKDFSPLLKDPNLVESHFQILQNIQENLNIVANHNGTYFLMDNQYNKIIDKNYNSLSFDNKEIYFTDEFKKTGMYRINHNGSLEFPLKEHWMYWEKFNEHKIYCSFTQNDTIFPGEIDEYGELSFDTLLVPKKFFGIYDAKIDNIILESPNPFDFFGDFILVEIEEKLRKEYELEEDEESLYLFSKNAKKILDKPICGYSTMYLDSFGEPTIDDEGNFQYLISLPIRDINNGNLKVISSCEGKSGVVDSNGNIIIPFVYDNFYEDIIENENIIVGIKNDQKDLFSIDVNGDLYRIASDKK